ncbi:MAG: LptA/OstA family protein [Gemmatimonadaceae bacterium]
MRHRGWTLGIALLALTQAACGRRSMPAPVVPVVLPTVPPVDTARPKPDSVPPFLPVQVPSQMDSAARAAARTERPAQRCVLDFLNTDETRFVSVKDPISGKYTTYVGGGVVGVCKSQPIRITSDSAESYDQNRLHYLIGNVKYREERVSLDADRLTYFQADERLVAEGNVVATMKDESSMRGPRAEYFRAVRGVRAVSRLVATARPTLTMYETDSLGQRLRGDPVTLVADNIVGEGESLFVAWGTVEIDRTDLKARGDSAVLDNTRQFSRLMKQPVVESKGSQPFTLSGRVIDIFGRSRTVDRVLAVDSAKAVNKDLTLSADTVDLRVADNKLQRAYAFGVTRATAVTRDRRILADSLDVVMPNQRIRELNAIGSAYAESDPDTAKVTTTERDWLRGDTIVARFDSVSTDTTTQPPIIDLVADGSASSFYHVPSTKGDKAKPGVNYVKGGRITIDFKEREVSTVTVDDSVFGVFLEAVQADSLPPGTPRPRPPARRPQQTPVRAPVRRPPSPDTWND